VQIRVYYEDTDCGGVVYHTNYLKFCERARSEKFFSQGISFDDNGYFVVSNLEANFIKSAKLCDILTVTTDILSIKKASVILEQKIFKDNILIFKANITLVYMIKDKISKIPDDKLAIFR